MAVVNYYSHIPLIRSEAGHRAFGPGALWRLPFDAWNAQTGGAFEDHREAYERTAPVFFFIELEVDWPFLVPGQLDKSSFFEIKKPSFGQDEKFEAMGFGFLTRFLNTVAWTAQAALSLAAPAAAPASPRSSMTLCTPDDHYFDLQNSLFSLARMQGDADHEWLLFPEACGPPLPESLIDLASAIWPLAQAARDNEDLAGATTSLLLCAEPTLAPRDQLMLATIALEALLLPEVRSRLEATFVRRLTSLLGGWSADIDLGRVARTLYDARSSALHGSKPKEEVGAKTLEQRCGAQQLLGASILALGPSVLSGIPLERVREELDQGNAPRPALQTVPLDLESPPGLRPEVRLTHRRYTSAPVVFVANGVMHAEEGKNASWSPLVGLACDEAVPVSAGDFAIVPLNAIELVQLEERDIQRDFINQLRVHEGLGTLPIETIGCIALFGEGRHEPAELQRRRTLAVEVLRLAGFSAFLDPELLGWYIYEGSIRYRRPTVLRQSVLHGIARPNSQRVAAVDRQRLEDMATLLGIYRTLHADDRIEALLEQFLRAHPSRFVPLGASAGSLFAILESVLGRFRPPRAAIQLEDLVSQVAGPDEIEWFRVYGRTFRNDVAHGRLPGNTRDKDTARLLATVRRLLEALIRFWIELDNRNAPPGKAFVAALESRLRW